MAKEICISSTPHETRLAILEDDQLAEIYYERENEYTLAGSIYNGRVTRVLPGMQSAFVDLGLERDAFLYVTDFIELDDQEETDELAQAAATAPPPREVRHPQEQSGRGDRGQRQEQRADRRPREKYQEESATEAAEADVASADSGEAAIEPAETAAGAGGRRWRGRRHRRGRGPRQSEAGEEQTSATPKKETPAPDEEFETAVEATVTSEFVPSIREEAGPSAPQKAAPAQFVLPGESLSKYGGSPAAETAKPEKAAPARPSVTSKPSTMIEVPLDWDPSSGLLPGESFSRRREHPREETPVERPAEDVVQPNQAATPLASAGHLVEEELEEEELVADTDETKPPALRELAFPHEITAPEALETLSEEDPFLEEETAETEYLEASEEAVIPVEIEEEETEPGTDASASHRVDSSSPSGFRLFGFGKKKEPEAPAQAPASVIHSSNYAPGTGRMEEEVIEGEEMESAPHRRHGQEEPHDDIYEEEQLPGAARTGALGEMLQEAHLDHRISMKLGQPPGMEEEEEVFDEDEEEGEADGQPAPGQPRRDRRDRGRRGRSGQQQRRGQPRRSMQTTDLPIISDLLKPGQEILVQIAKEPIAKKGARITSHIALPGRFLVFMPTVTHVGVSRKIASDEERHRLKRILTHERGDSTGGFIVRTAADGASEEELRADLRFLMNLWNEIKQRSESSKSPALIYHDLSLIERILRDQVSDNFSNIWVDSEADYERIVRFLNRFSPSLVRRVKLYTKETPLFEHFGIQDEISKALRSKVWLKSGGSIVINQTEALVAIDINTGKYVGKSARLEDTILKTNLDAVPEIVRQIRLRDLGGIIVIDFIDMDERKNRFKVMAALEEALKSDRAPTKVLQFNDFGLVAITRKRVKQSLERTLSVPCYTCQATGMVKSPATVCNEIWIELRKMRKHFEGSDVLLRVHPETVKILKSNNARWLNDYEELIAKNVLVKSDASLHPEQFDIQG
jgi:ribonuclease G